MKLSGKTVLITGAARRIGREIALLLAKAGADIVLHYRDSKSEAESLKRKIESLRRRVYLVQADFLKENAVQEFSKQVFRQAKRVDVLINNASIFYPTPLERISEEDWDDFMTANLKAPFFLAKIFGLQMKKRKSGKIINIVDWTAGRPPANYLPYAISKAGLVAATQGLAKALAPSVQVAGIAPGPILPAEKASKKEQQKAAEKSLLKRYGHPYDIAETVRFLIEGTDFITGSIVYVEGGAQAL